MVVVVVAVVVVAAAAATIDSFRLSLLPPFYGHYTAQPALAGTPS